MKEMSKRNDYFTEFDKMDERKKRAGRADDRLEANNRDFFEKIINGYEELSKLYKNRFIPVNADRGEDAIFADIWNRIKEHL